MLLIFHLLYLFVDGTKQSRCDIPLSMAWKQNLYFKKSIRAQPLNLITRNLKNLFFFLTVISFPVFSALLAKLIAATAAAPDEIPT